MSTKFKNFTYVHNSSVHNINIAFTNIMFVRQ